MTDYSKWACRIALIYMVIGFTIGAMMLADKGFILFPRIVVYLPVHYEFLLMGWILNMAFGVAYWMFPRFTPKETGMRSRGFVRAAWIGLFLLNAGILIFASTIVFSLSSQWQILGRLLEASGVVAFAINAIPRVKPVKDV
jgi:hypothetical protein